MSIYLYLLTPATAELCKMTSCLFQHITAPVFVPRWSAGMLSKWDGPLSYIASA